MSGLTKDNNAITGGDDSEEPEELIIGFKVIIKSKDSQVINQQGRTVLSDIAQDDVLVIPLKPIKDQANAICKAGDLDYCTEDLDMWKSHGYVLYSRMKECLFPMVGCHHVRPAGKGSR